MELGLEGGGLAVGVAEVDGRDLAGRAEIVAGVEDDVLAVALAAVVMEEVGAEAVTVWELWAGEEEQVLAIVGAWV